MVFRAESFDATKLPLLANFDCGIDVFGKIATDWIKCVDPADSALSSMRESQSRGLFTEVYLYFEENELLGFGSVGTTTRQLKREQQLWSIIPHVGIDIRFRKRAVAMGA